MLPVGYGAMVLESFVGVIAIVTAGIMFSQMNTSGTGALNAGVLHPVPDLRRRHRPRHGDHRRQQHRRDRLHDHERLRARPHLLDAVARIARSSFQEFFYSSNDAAAASKEKATGARKVMTNVYFSTAVSLLVGLVLCFGGYLGIWPLFGASNQLLGGMTMITLAVFCKVTGRKALDALHAVAFLLCCTFTSLPR